jgi:hypothetical protein
MLRHVPGEKAIQANAGRRRQEKPVLVLFTTGFEFDN